MSCRTETPSALRFAVALGIGLLSLASQAELIVRDYNGPKADNSTISVDVDANGLVDFYLEDLARTDLSEGLVYANTSTGHAVGTTGRGRDGNYMLKRFAAGDAVDASSMADGWKGGYTHRQGPSSSFGAWGVGDTGYIGVEIRYGLGDTPHYGWIELTRGSLTIGQIGFQTTAGVGAQIPAASTQNNAPEPGSLALLVAGALAAAATRARAPRH